MIEQAFEEESIISTRLFEWQTEKSESGEEQSQGHSQHFPWHQGDCSQRIFPSIPNS
jgi:hypothetical protein